VLNLNLEIMSIHIENSSRGILTEMQFFRAWKSQNEGLLRTYYNEAIIAATALFVDKMEFDEFCAVMFENNAWMIPSCNN
jgi:Rps23 Pro-64 3,4-dihydroxylase Tpa1-like proline 4-hydroxylase